MTTRIGLFFTEKLALFKKKRVEMAEERLAGALLAALQEHWDAVEGTHKRRGRWRNKCWARRWRLVTKFSDWTESGEVEQLQQLQWLTTVFFDRGKYRKLTRKYGYTPLGVLIDWQKGGTEGW